GGGDAQVEVAEQQAAEQRRLGGDQQDHFPPADRALAGRLQRQAAKRRGGDAHGTRTACGGWGGSSGQSQPTIETPAPSAPSVPRASAGSPSRLASAATHSASSASASASGQPESAGIGSSSPGSASSTVVPRVRWPRTSA